MDMIRRDTDKEDEIENYIKNLQDRVKKDNVYSVGGRIYFKKRRKVKQTKRRRYKNKYSKRRC